MLEERSLLLAALAAAAGDDQRQGCSSPVDAALAALCPVAVPRLAERSGRAAPRLPASELELSAVGSSFRAVLVLGEACEGVGGVWSEIASWLGIDSSKQLMLVDVESSCRLGLRMSRLVEGKKFVVTIGGIAEALFPGIPCPDEIQATEASQQATAVVVSIVDICSKISAAVAENRSGQTVISGVCSEVALGTLLGQVIWLIGYCRERWIGSLEPPTVCPLPSLVIVSTFWGKSNDSGAVARIVEWTSKGGTKDTIPPDDLDLREAYFGSAGDKAKKPPLKGKGKDEMVTPIRGVIWMRRSSLKVTAAFPPDTSLSKGETSPREYAMSVYFDTIAKERTGQAEGSAVGVLRRLSRRCRGALLLYIIGDTPTEGDDALASELLVKSNLAVVELASAVILDGCGVRTAGEIAVTDVIPMVREPSVVSVETASITSASDAECEFNLVAAQRVLDLMEDRRKGLAPEALLRLNHLALRNHLPPLQLFQAIEALQSAKAAQVELLTPILRQLSEQLVGVAEFIREKESAAGLAREMASLSSKWTDLCSLFIKRIRALPEDFTMQQLIVQVNDLLCCIGDAIDDVHRRHSFNASKLKEEAQSFLDGNFMNRTQDLIASLIDFSERLCTEFSIAFEHVAGLLQIANYERIPWTNDFPVDYNTLVSMLSRSLKELSEIRGRPEKETDPVSEKLPQLLELVKDDVWRRDAVLGAIRVCCTIINSLVLAYRESRERVNRIPHDVQDTIDAFCDAAHRQLNDWDSRISSLLVGSTGNTSSDFRSLLKLSNAPEVRDKIKTYINANVFNVDFDPDRHPTVKQSIDTVAVPMEVAVEISRNLGLAGRDVQDFESALNSIFAELSARGPALPSLLTSGGIFAEFPTNASFRSKHKLLAQALVRNEYGTIPISSIRRICALFANTVVDLPTCIPLQHFLNEAISDNKVLSSLRLPRSQALLLFETIAWSCVDADSNVLPSEFFNCLCQCVVREALIPPAIESSIRNLSSGESYFSSRHWAFARLINLACSEQDKGVTREAKVSAVTLRLMSSGMGISWRQMHWIVEAFEFSPTQEISLKLEPRLLPSLGLVESFDQDDNPAERTQDSETAPAESEVNNVNSEEPPVDGEEVVATPLASKPPKYAIVEVGEPFLLGTDVIWSCNAHRL